MWQFYNTNVPWSHKSLFCKIHTSFGGRRRNAKLKEDNHMFIELFAVPSTSCISCKITISDSIKVDNTIILVPELIMATELRQLQNMWLYFSGNLLCYLAKEKTWNRPLYEPREETIYARLSLPEMTVLIIVPLTLPWTQKLFTIVWLPML